MKAALAVLCLLAMGGAARAGAWTEQRGHWQSIAGVWVSSADTGFDDRGSAALPVTFEKVMLETASDYGVRDWLTVFVNTETAYARSSAAPDPHAYLLDNAYEGGARLRLFDRYGIVSVQSSFKQAGAFNFAVSADSGAAGHVTELRLLYGTSFKTGARDGFLDIEAGQRWLSAPRPDEVPVDVTAGLWLNRNWLVMAQSFNLVSSGDTAPPYRHYRSHKLQLSIVRRLSEQYLIQAGAFFSPFGRNALVEQGACLSLWAKL